MVDLLTVSQTSLHNKQVMQRRQILDRVVPCKNDWKRGTSYRGTGSLEAVSTLCDEKVYQGTFITKRDVLSRISNHKITDELAKMNAKCKDCCSINSV